MHEIYLNAPKREFDWWLLLAALALVVIVQPIGICQDRVHPVAGQLPEPAAGGIAAAKVFLAVLGYTVLPFVLILKEPDLGSALVFLPSAWR
jgi:hypothetical protein